MQAADLDDSIWRAGAHTDYDCLTLLHQRPGEHGLQLCPGADVNPLGWLVSHHNEWLREQST